MPDAAKLQLRHYLAYALLCLIWGTTWMAIRVLVRDVPPVRGAGIRFLIGGVILLVIALVMRMPWPAGPTGKQQWQSMALLSLTMIAIPYGLIFWAEQYVTSSVAAVLYSSLPLCTALLTPLFTGVPVPRAALFSLLVAVGGIAMLFGAELNASTQTLAGGVMVLVAVFFSSYSSIYAKKKINAIHPMVSTGVQLLGGAVALMAVSLATEHQPSVWSKPAIAALLFLAILGSSVAFAVYYWMLKVMPPYKLSTLTLIVPFVAIVEGALILQENITLNMLVSSIVVLGAVAVVLRADSDEATEMKLGKAGN